MFVGPQSGKFGVVHNQGIPITNMFNWNIDSINHSPETYYASNTYWGPNRNPGVLDWSGSFSVFDGSWVAFPGGYFACLEFFTAPFSGVYGNVGEVYVGQAIVDSVNLSWQWGVEQSLTQVVNFSANGSIVSRSRVIDDTVLETPSKMCGLNIQWDFGESPSSFVPITNVQQASLSFTAQNQSFVNSSTGCSVHRRPGNIDWSLGLTLTDHRAVAVNRNDLVSFRLWNSPTTYWETIYGIFSNVSGITADRQSGAIQTQVANFIMKGLSNNTVGGINWFNGTTNVGMWPILATGSTVPGVPGTPTPTQSGTDVNVAWAAASGATGYTIWASEDGIDFAAVGCSNDTSFIDVGISTGGTPYTMYYKISGYNTEGQGVFSPIGSTSIT